MDTNIDCAPVTTNSAPTHRIHFQDWWLKTAIGKARAEETCVRDDNGNVIARMPYIHLWQKGLPWGTVPFWTAVNGPIVHQSLTGPETYDVVSKLLKQLPRLQSYDFSVPGNLKHIGYIRQAFIDAGFEHSAREWYSQNPPPAKTNLEKMNSKQSGKIRKAERELDLITIDAEEFIEFFAANLKDRGRRSNSPLDIAHNLIVEAQKHNPSHAIILAAKRKPTDGTEAASPEQIPLDAAVVILMDDMRAYLWWVTHRPGFPDQSENKPNSHAIKFLAIKAAELAGKMGLIFDTAGNQGSEDLYRDCLQFDVVELQHKFERRAFIAHAFRDANILAKRTIQDTKSCARQTADRIRARKATLSRMAKSIAQSVKSGLR